MKKTRKVVLKFRAPPVFTLDRDAGLVVSRKVLVKEGIMKRQIDATKKLFDASAAKEKAKARG
ncbi:hypothetical protein GCM10011521_20860 [Arenimonas soli]|uniref:Uncharacterized protein n=1 Tax=Arenimonas soli TaxID=2269504 RepID=A0ABQ1HLG4_9GAMM|nr:hypothetical protein GCM10011521_20860 [Arenimonas soli]